MSSGPVYSVTPVQGHSGSKVDSEIHKKTAEDNGPLKEMIKSQQDSLYKYISWEDPVRTLRSYFIALSVLFGTHYLPLTRWTMKAGATTFGAIFLTEFVSRLFGPNTFLTQMRPKTYKKVPEDTLNATLKDIHDLVQYTVIKFQRIVFAEDLDNTFVAFVGFASLYWLTKVIPPFWLAVMTLTTIYTVPLISPRGREVAYEAKARAEELSTAAVENGKQLAQDGQAKVAQLTSMTQEMASNIGQRSGDLAQTGKRMATDLSTQATNTVSNVSKATADKVKTFPEAGSNALYNAPGTAKSALNDAGQYISTTFSRAGDVKNDDESSVTDEAHSPSSSTDSTKNTASSYVLGTGSSARDATDTTREHMGNTLSSTPRQVSSEATRPVTDPVSKYSTSTNTTTGILNQS